MLTVNGAFVLDFILLCGHINKLNSLKYIFLCVGTIKLYVKSCFSITSLRTSDYVAVRLYFYFRNYFFLQRKRFRL